MLKDKMFKSGEDTTELTRDGLLSILTKLRRDQPADSTKTSVSISTESSTSDQDSQCRELLKQLELMLDSEDGIQED
jgi:hypothetical protein